ncbi:MAG: 3-oxoacyl-ACP synthase III family protein [Bacteroidota bacterium]
MHNTRIVMTGTGSYVPEQIITNEEFSKNQFFNERGEAYAESHGEIAQKFEAITGISERRHVCDKLVASDIGTIAARLAVEDAGIDQETIDQLIVAQNFGDVQAGTIQSDAVPSLASRIKQQMGIKNPACVGYDLLFGCPGWVQGLIHAQAFIQSGMAKRCLVVATETLSRVVDVHDRDSMIFADGAGACVVEGRSDDGNSGILSMEAGTWACDEADYLYMGQGYKGGADPAVRYIKMFGRKIYEFALTHVPAAMKSCLDKAGLDISEVKKVLIHQANEKMDNEIIKRLFRLYKRRDIPEGIMPMSIHKLGNSSVATVPTLLDQIRRGTAEGDHEINKGDVILMASVGAGMNINAVAYRY